MHQGTLRVGVIGAGQNTRDRHIPGLLAQDDVDIVAVCNRSLASGRRVAERFDIPVVARHWREIVESPALDAVVIGTWPYLHATTTVAALEAGKHVMCEARMAMNAAEARRMHRASLAHPQLVAQIVPSPMTLGVDRTVQRLMTQNYLGTPLVVDAQVGGTWLDTEGPLHWRHDLDRSGCNIMSMGIWYEALMRWVGEAVSVSAMGRVFVPRRMDEETGTLRAVRIPEHVDISAEMACGAQLHMQVSAVTGLAGPPHITLYGSAGTLRFTAGELLGGQRGDESLAPLEIPEGERGAWRVEEEFVNAVRGREAITHTDFATGVKYMEFTEAVTRSLQTGRVIPLPLPGEA